MSLLILVLSCVLTCGMRQGAASSGCSTHLPHNEGQTCSAGHAQMHFVLLGKAQRRGHVLACRLANDAARHSRSSRWISSQAARLRRTPSVDVATPSHSLPGRYDSDLRGRRVSE